MQTGRSACRPVAVLDEREPTGGLIARDQAADAKRTQPALATLASLQHLRLNGHRGLLIEIRRSRYAFEFRDPETQRLRPAETRDDRRDGLEDRVRHDEVGQTEARTAFEHLISDPRHVADEYRWHREHVLGRHTGPASCSSDPLGRAQAVIGDHEHNRAAQLDRAGSRPGVVQSPADLAGDHGRRPSSWVVTADTTGGGNGLQPDDVGLSRSKRQDLMASAADEDRGPRSLYRRREELRVAQRVVSAREVADRRVHESGDQVDCLLETAYPCGARVEGPAELLVFPLREAGPKTKLEPPAGEVVDGRDLLRQLERMPIVVAEHKAADAQRRRDGGHRGEGGDGAELRTERLGHEVIANEEGR